MPEQQTKPAPPKSEADDSAKILRAVEELTDSEPVEDGAELIGDPETARKFREAKEAAYRREPIKAASCRQT